VYPARYMVERFSFAVHEHRKSVLVSAATGQPWGGEAGSRLGVSSGDTLSLGRTTFT
jgi:hypothetical protein